MRPDRLSNQHEVKQSRREGHQRAHQQRGLEGLRMLQQPASDDGRERTTEIAAEIPVICHGRLSSDCGKRCINLFKGILAGTRFESSNDSYIYIELGSNN